jgi:3-hydroxyacyl-[acyl-carrier-protein] dehydratase
MRFYLVDRITEMKLGESIKGIKCWSMSDDVFNEHFPGFPIVPGVLAIESMAQLLGTLLEKTHIDTYGKAEESYAVLSIVHKAKFKGFLLPGDQAHLEGTLTSVDRTHGSGSVKTFVEGKLVSQCELSFALIPQKELANQRLSDMRHEYFSILTGAKEKRNQSTR